jgi:hypothetical protein
MYGSELKCGFPPWPSPGWGIKLHLRKETIHFHDNLKTVLKNSSNIFKFSYKKKRQRQNV